MNRHDEIRAMQAQVCDRDNLESLADALLGLQSTDDPDLVPLYKELQARYWALKDAFGEKRKTGGMESS